MLTQIKNPCLQWPARAVSTSSESDLSGRVGVIPPSVVNAPGGITPALRYLGLNALCVLCVLCVLWAFAAPRAHAQQVAPPAVKSDKSAAPASSVAPKGATPRIGIVEAARRYADGLELEQRGDQRGALAAFLEAGDGGNGLAQRKLGDIYGTGNAAVARDYETSLRWYERARRQGIEIPRPITYFGARPAPPQGADMSTAPSAPSSPVPGTGAAAKPPASPEKVAVLAPPKPAEKTESSAAPKPEQKATPVPPASPVPKSAAKPDLPQTKPPVARPPEKVDGDRSATPAAKPAPAAITPSVAVAPVSTPPPTPKVVAKPVQLGRLEASRRFTDGVGLDRRGDQKGALIAYTEAAESGNGLAQKKLGDIYGTGNQVVARDYETSLRWYDLARQQGVEIPKPFTFPGARQ